MSTELIVAVFAGITSLISAVGVIVVGIYTARIKESNETDGVKKDEKLDQIHVLVNSRLSEALDHIVQLQTVVSKFTGMTETAIKAATDTGNLTAVMQDKTDKTDKK